MKEVHPYYEALRVKDPRFDGIFFVGVKTTGIYCRPRCQAPLPKEENCTFFKLAPEAEAAGYRPCLRCRPEMAPAYADYNQKEVLMTLVLKDLDVHLKEGMSLEALAARQGISSRHLRRLFKDLMGISPSAYSRTHKLLRAKTLLTDTNLSMSEVAYKAGFTSLSRFNATMKTHYGLTPSAIRKGRRPDPHEDLRVKLNYRPPYDWSAMLEFLRLRAIPYVEAVREDGSYIRSLRVLDQGKEHIGWLEVVPKPQEACLSLRLSRSLEPVLLDVLQGVRQLFDLNAACDIYQRLPQGIRLPGTLDAFELCVRAVLGQQITVAAATTLAGRMVSTFGEATQTPFPEITRVFPHSSLFVPLNDDHRLSLESSMQDLGIIRSRGQTICRLANAFTQGQLNFRGGQDPYTLRKELEAIKGIGPWTAAYVIMRAYPWPDIFLIEDLIVRQRVMAYFEKDLGFRPTEDKEAIKAYDRQVSQKMEALRTRFSPWGSYLTLAIWQGKLEVLDDI